MECEVLGKCGGCECISLDEKIKFANEILNFKNADIFKSSEFGFRARGELGVYHFDNRISFAMRGVESKFICIKNCKNLVPNIQKTIKILIEILNTEPFSDFIYKLFSLEILANKRDSLLLSFIYHKKIDESFLKNAAILKEYLSKATNLNYQIIGRSRGVKLVLEQDFVQEYLRVLNKDYVYRYDEGAFTQPNTYINEKMISWVLEHIKGGGDLLEMYCGCGNFTMPLARKFNKILATEISKTSIKAAKFACEKNGIPNVYFARLSGAECIEAIQRLRAFNRLREIDLDAFNFTSIFVDPPRAGVGSEVCKFLGKFNQIIYISCNPNSLAKDLEILKQTHKVEHCAFFDQFPHTRHLECGVILSRS